MSVSPESSICTISESLQRDQETEHWNQFVEMKQLEQNPQCKVKVPRRVIHFSSGETMEEFSSDEEQEPEPEPENKDLHSASNTSALPWGPYLTFHMWRAAASTVSACDYVGERMVALLGLNTAKYQYAIDQHHHANSQKEKKVREEAQGSEEAESHFEGKRNVQIPVQQISQA